MVFRGKAKKHIPSHLKCFLKSCHNLHRNFLSAWKSICSSVLLPRRTRCENTRVVAIATNDTFWIFVLLFCYVCPNQMCSNMFAAALEVVSSVIRCHLLASALAVIKADKTHTTVTMTALSPVLLSGGTQIDGCEAVGWTLPRERLCHGTCVAGETRSPSSSPSDGDWMLLLSWDRWGDWTWRTPPQPSIVLSAAVRTLVPGTDYMFLKVGDLFKDPSTCFNRFTGKSSSPGSALDLTWVIVLTSVCLCGIILGALLLFVFLRGR